MPSPDLPSGPSPELVERLSRTPDIDAPDADESPADRFLRLACLRYGSDDGPARWQAATAMLGADPSLAEAFPVAVACADIARVTGALAADGSLARRECGPFRWEPAMYLAYARHDPAVTEADAVATLRALLAAGADPDAGYLWHALIPPFTLMTGLLGNGEEGSASQPPHPHAPALARLLLESGADPNDRQALYNRQFQPDDTHLRLLLEFGLGRGDGGPWRRRLAPQQPDPATVLREQLVWACTHDLVGRVTLLAEHGVDLESALAEGAYRGGRTPLHLAAVTGSAGVARTLLARGVPPLTDPVDRYLLAVLTPDAAALDAIEVAYPGLRAATRAAYPALVLRAVATGRQAAVREALRRGFDVNARGRMDLPLDQPWESALHAATQLPDRRSREGIVDLLLTAGADRTARDRRFRATPAGWAEHAGHRDLAVGLQP